METRKKKCLGNKKIQKEEAVHIYYTRPKSKRSKKKKKKGKKEKKKSIPQETLFREEKPVGPATNKLPSWVQSVHVQGNIYNPPNKEDR